MGIYDFLLICQLDEFQESHQHTLNFLDTQYGTANQVYHFQQTKQILSISIFAYSVKCLGDSMATCLLNTHVKICMFYCPT